MEQQRQLAAIVFTDIVGYTRLMGADEHKAMKVLERNREVQLPLIERFNGRFIKELGDGTMASFSNAYDAVRCAIEVQKLTKDDADLNLRIGIHQGEVIFENDDVFGDGVNVAARIESAGRPGAVFISGPVFNNVSNKSDIETRFIEQMQLKNVNRPIDIYEVAVDGKFSDTPTKPKTTKASGIGKYVGLGIAAIALAFVFWFAQGTESSPDKQLDHASIAVLPFTNMSSDEDNEFFCDGVTEDILTHLSKLKNLKVISRTSIMHFKGSELTIPEIAKQLDVEYIVEGSVRKQGGQVSITAQLIHAANDEHLWAENYERELQDVFAIQREVAQSITNSLNLKISLKEREGLKRSMTENVEAYQEYLKGKAIEDTREESGLLQATEHYRRAIELDPLFAEAYAMNGRSHLHLWSYYQYDRDSVYRIMDEMLAKAFEIDSANSVVLSSKAAYLNNQSWGLADDDSLEAASAYFAKRAIDIDPNNAYAYMTWSNTLYSGDVSEPQRRYELRVKAAELDPFSSVIQINVIHALCELGRLEEAEQYLTEHQALFSRRQIIENKRHIAERRMDWKECYELRKEVLSTNSNRTSHIDQLAGLHLYLFNDPEGALNILLDGKGPLELLGYQQLRYLHFLSLLNDKERAENFIRSKEEMEPGTEETQIARAYFLYYWKDFVGADAIFEKVRPEGVDRYSCWIYMGREDEVRKVLSDPANDIGDYVKTYLFAGLGELDSALHYFEKFDHWGEVARSRFDQDMEPLWNEPRYKAKLAEYNFTTPENN